MADIDTAIGYCPYCCERLRTLSDSNLGGYQVTCGCRNLIVPYAEAQQRGLRRAWEVAVGLRTRFQI